MADQNVKYWQQANEIYADLTDLSVSEAIAKLHQLPHVNDQVKSLVLSLISAGQQSSHYFDEAMSSYRQVIKHSYFEVGQKVGDYRLIESLDQGGTAEVYTAEKIDSEVQKPVAIKLFNHPGYLSHLSDRFQIEQKVLAGLSHPNIVKLYHGGHSQDGVPYMVMELVEGARTIDQYVAVKKLSTRGIVRLMIQAARAVAYAHTNLVVHRDIKPSNILVDDQDTLKVVDFGIAKLLNQPKDPQKTTLLALTPNYAAPEQIKSESISVRTDVFSLAAVCLQLITDEPPLSENRLLNACQNDDQHVRKLLKSAVKDSDLRKVLYQALQSDSSRRYRHMDLFADDLQAWLSRRPVTASRDSFFYRIHKFAQRRTALFVTSVALVVFALSSLIVFSWQYQKTLVEANKAMVVKDFMLKVFSYADPSQQLAENLSALDLLAMAETEALNRNWSDSDTEADILVAIGSAYFNLGQWQRAEKLINQAIELDPSLITGQLALIAINLNQSQIVQADKIFQQLPLDFQKEFSDSPELVAEWYMLKSLRTTFDDDHEAGLNYIGKAFNIYQQNNHVDGQLKTAQIWAEKLQIQSQEQQALQLVRDTLTQLKDQVSAVNINLLQLQTTEIYLYNILGEYQGSLSQANNVINNIKTLLGDQHPMLIDALVQRANIYKNTGQFDDALNDAKTSLQIAESVFGEVSQMSQQALSILLQLNFAMGNRDQALEQLKRVVEMSKKNYGLNNRMTLDAQIELANYLGASGQFDEAIALAEQTIIQSQSVYGPKHDKTIKMNNIWLKLLTSADLVNNQVVTQAIDNNRSALENLGKTHPQTAYSYFVLGGVYAADGQYVAANKAYLNLIENNIVTPDNPRYLALCQAITQNYKAAGQLDNAFEYAQKGWQAAEKMMGSQATRTLQLRLAMLDLMNKDDAKYANHIQDLQRMMDGITDPMMLQALTQWLQENVQ